MQEQDSIWWIQLEKMMMWEKESKYDCESFKIKLSSFALYL